MSEASPFEQLRTAEFPWTRDHIYLNAASIGPIPDRTRRAVEAFGRRRAAPQDLPDAELMGVLERARASVAQLINASVDEIALTPNTSVGINVAAGALPLGAEDVVVVSEREFPANVYPWFALRDRRVLVELVPTTATGWPDEERLLDRVADPAVKALALSSVQFASGFHADLDRIGAACRDNDTFFVVDAIQSLGQVPLDVKRTPVDIVCSGGQKWLLSPWGSGFTYVRHDLIEQLRPPFAGWMAFQGTDDFSRLTDYAMEYRRTARRFEVGTIPFQDVLGMAESVDMLLALGIERIRDHIVEVLAPIRAAAERDLIEVTSPVDPVHRSAITCLRPPRVDVAFERLKDAGIACSLREGAIRVSPHCYNAVGEMERVVEVLG